MSIVEKEFKIDGEICTLEHDGDIQIYKNEHKTIAFIVRDDYVLYAIYGENQSTEIIVDSE